MDEEKIKEIEEKVKKRDEELAMKLTRLKLNLLYEKSKNKDK